MPKRNAIKQYGEGELYHLYNRGVAKMDIFREEADYEYLIELFKKYLSPEKRAKDSNYRTLPNYADSLELVAYCLMPNHYHLLVYLKEEAGIERLMRSVMTAYSMYFNKKYKRVGGLFESRFLASRISSEAYWQHISRYIHLNPIDLQVDYLTYPHSSVEYYTCDKRADWLHPERACSKGGREYVRFLREYESVHSMYAQIKHELAHR